MWFNPPFDASMTTKLGKVFLNILDKNFPVGHIFWKVFNRHTVQLSYRTMPNMASIIAANNRRLLKEVPDQLPDQLPRNKNCNCRGGAINCPMDGARCLDNKVKYQATVVEEGNPEAAIRQQQLQHKAGLPEDLLLLARLCVEAEDLAVAHHLQPFKPTNTNTTLNLVHSCTIFFCCLDGEEI